MKFSNVSILVICSLLVSTTGDAAVYRYGFNAPGNTEYFFPNPTGLKNRINECISYYSSDKTTKTVTIKDGLNTLTDTWYFYGGKSANTNDNVTDYTLKLDNLTGNYVYGYGGHGSDGNISKNKVFVNNSTVKTIYGGNSTDLGSVTENEVNVKNSTVVDAVYGGRSASSTASNAVSNNKVTIENSTVADVYGGSGGSATGNNVFLNEANITGSLYGANKFDENHYDNNLILAGYNNSAGSVLNFSAIKFGFNDEKLTFKKDATVLKAGSFSNANNLDLSNIVLPENILENLSEHLSEKMILIEMSENNELPDFNIKNETGAFEAITTQGVKISSGLTSLIYDNFNGLDVSLNYDPFYHIVKERNALISQIKGKVNEVIFGEIPWKENNEPLIEADGNLDFNSAKVNTEEIVFKPNSVTSLLANDNMILIKDFGDSVGEITGTKYKIGTTLEGEGSAKLENSDLIFTINSNSTPIPQENPTPDPEPTPTPEPEPEPTPPPKPKEDSTTDDSDDAGDDTNPTEPITPPKVEPTPTENSNDNPKDNSEDSQDKNTSEGEESKDNQDSGKNEDDQDKNNPDSGENKDNQDNQETPKEQEPTEATSTDSVESEPKSSSSVSTQEQTHNTVMSAEAGLLALAVANDYIGTAMDGISADAKSSADGFASYVGLGGMNAKTKTGSSVNAHLWNAILALGQERKLKNGLFSYGAFFEYGKASYTLEPDNGMKGSSNYKGGGVFLKHTNNQNVYVEGSFRAGKMTDSSSRILKDGFGNSYGYDVSANYFGLHFGVGKIYKLKNNYELDAYVKFFYTRRGGVSYDAGGHYDLDPVSSKVLRIGARYGKKNVGWNTYFGLHYSYEFDGVARGTADGYSIRPASVKGGTICGEIGLRLQPSATSKWKSDISLKASAGKTRGFGGNISLMYLF